MDAEAHVISKKVRLYVVGLFRAGPYRSVSKEEHHRDDEDEVDKTL